MKKTVFLFSWLMFCAVTGFSKQTEIINTPIPHAKFKWLLVIRHINYPEHTHFVYLNKYHTLKEDDGWVWLFPDGQYEMFEADSVSGVIKSDTLNMIDYKIIILEEGKRGRIQSLFFKSKAPKPSKLHSDYINSSDTALVKRWIKSGKIIKYKSIKAKVIFKQ